MFNANCCISTLFLYNGMSVSDGAAAAAILAAHTDCESNSWLSCASDVGTTPQQHSAAAEHRSHNGPATDPEP
jgi:hypothetical protein